MRGHVVVGAAEEEDRQVADDRPAAPLRRQAGRVHSGEQARHTAHHHELCARHQPLGPPQSGHLSHTGLAARDQPVQGGVREVRRPRSARGRESARDELRRRRAQALLARAARTPLSARPLRLVHQRHARHISQTTTATTTATTKAAAARARERLARLVVVTVGLALAVAPSASASAAALFALAGREHRGDEGGAHTARDGASAAARLRRVALLVRLPQPPQRVQGREHDGLVQHRHMLGAHAHARARRQADGQSADGHH